MAGNECKACGMLVEPANAYHPYAACLMFKSCQNGNTVQANLDAVVEHGRGLALEPAGDAEDARHAANKAWAKRFASLKPRSHDGAQATIAAAVQQIQMVCDAFGYDPCQWLQDDVAQSSTKPAPSVEPSGEDAQFREVRLQLARKLLELKPMAERYQFLRGRDSKLDYCLYCGYDGLPLVVGEELDRAIDDARLALTKGGESNG